MNNWFLCYVSGGSAWFANVPPDQVWGDDWNDAPYEHNAGDPYSHDGVETIRVYYSGWFETPADIANGNSGLSVQMINWRAAPWLTNATCKPRNADAVSIFAGTTIDEFREMIWLGGGDVYERTPRPASTTTQQEAA